MKNIFAIYASIILMGFTGAAYGGYALNSMFMNSHHASKTDNHYHK